MMRGDASRTTMVTVPGAEIRRQLLQDMSSLQDTEGMT